jgi:hypothetical protein
MVVAFPKYVTTTECVGRAMLKLAKRGAPKPVIENQDITPCLPEWIVTSR